MRPVHVLPMMAALIMLSACGHDPGERAVSGAGIGAGVGAVGGALVGGDPVTGAVVGGAAGAATGALTRDKDINLGRPIWER
jgi:osmotically inducible lipoprotein OsmB